ncbi:MAG: Protein of unknown function (DUF1553)/Protein of unknown function (DUF1549)/Planctomycete [Chthoniobacteraceae bacterium]|nr:Protein of unknown function (DUF1553)/Protein of unknown function (DUF1549)/Planctomycete [Chthoniobacteraceae bacterium]
MLKIFVMNAVKSHAAALWFGLVLFVSDAPAQNDAAGLEFFENKIRPVLADQCYKCHSVDAKKIKGGLRLDTREDLLKGGTNGAAIVPGQPDASLLIEAVRYEEKDLQMPPAKDGGKKLPDAVIADLAQWVKMGAPFPAASARAVKDQPKHLWAFDPIQNPPSPAVRNAAWIQTPVDAFILAKLEKRGLSPSVPADKRTLIRRATFDLTGLPPTPEEIDRFLADESPDAFSRVVDRLLSSPRYGEQWGRHWLDVVRYADTAGETADYPVPLAWRYRNYVIDAFNSDKPYDEFLREQIAGDILASQGPRESYAERATATGFLAISRRFGFDSENYHHLTIQDTLDTMGQSVLGLSLGCARCHDHKFDPVSMVDYYALYGIFESSSYAFPGSEQKPRSRALMPLIPPRESQPKWRDFDMRVASLMNQLEQQKQPVPAAVLRSLDDGDGDFEMQAPAAGGSNGVLVEPWLWEGQVGPTNASQSPFKNLYPLGRCGVNIAPGEKDYRIARSLTPRRTRENTRLLYLNLDFRVAPNSEKAKGPHRFWIGASVESPAVELFISSDAISIRAGDTIEKICATKLNQWQNLQLALDLENRTVSGSVGAPGEVVTFAGKPFSPGWSGLLDYVAIDSRGNSHPGIEIDNIGAQESPIPAASTTAPLIVSAKGANDLAALSAQLQQLTGLDGDLESQADGALAKPWMAGPRSVVKVSTTAQSPFQNIFGGGRFGISMPNRAEYDGFIQALPSAWKADKTALLHASFDFRCASKAAGGDGSWRFYLGHGAGASAAVELYFNDREFFRRDGDARDVAGALRIGEWYQVQLVLNLKEKTFTGSLSTRSERKEFAGKFATGWDGIVDHTFIDSYGHLPGVRPALEFDNFTIAETPLPPLDAPPVQVATTEARRAQVEGLRQQLLVLQSGMEESKRELEKLLIAGPFEMTYGVVEGTPHNARLQMRGEPDRPGKEAPRGFIKALGGGALPPDTAGSGRLELANWLTRAENPLTARVMVNRIWQYHFGHGLVKTPNDFGARGLTPTHPELLDYLATHFMQGGWSIKSMHRLIMLSATYRESSIASAAGEEHDTGDLYASFARRRLSAEELRDSILAISGELDLLPGREHPFPSPTSWGFSQHGPFNAVYEHNKRSVYLMTQRIKRHPFLALFDGADPNTTTAERRSTTVPTQALFFLNDPFVHAKAEKCASRLQLASPGEPERIESAWRLALGRLPTETERAEAILFLANYRAELTAAGQGNNEITPLSAYVRALFGSNEFLHID